MSNRQPRLPNLMRSGLMGAALCVFLGLFFYFPTWHGLYLFSYDLPVKFRSGTPPDGAVIVFMDQESRDRLQQPSDGAWNRSLHAALIRQLSHQGARAIALDILLADTNTNSTDKADADLAQALRESTNVVLAANQVVQKRDQQYVVDVEKPDPVLGATNWGVVNLESKGAIRTHFWSDLYPTFASKTAERAGYRIPKQDRERWINYYGPNKTIPNIPFVNVLSNNVPPGLFEQRTVFVGRLAQVGHSGMTEDEHPTPNDFMPGVEIQATVFLNLIHEDWLNELPQWMLFSLFLFVGSGAGFGFVHLRPWVAARWAIGGIVSFTVLGFVLPQFHYWFPWLIIVVIQIPTALVWSVISNSRRIYAEKALLEETLATARSAIRPSPQAVGQLDAATRTELSDPLLSPDAATLVAQPAGPRIPDMELIRTIGQGAYGEVWLGRDILGTYKAVKIVYRSRFSSATPFDREFRGLQKFTPISRSHPGFVHILHVGRNEQAGFFYAIMEIGDDESTGQTIDPQSYVPRTLSKEVRRRGKLPVQECLELSLALADALDYLHGKRLIHRDIKPSNIIFSNGQPKFADIGLVTDLAARGGDVTYLGTEGFIAPEGPGTAAADVYSLGKVIYETSMGRDREFFPELPTTLVDRPDRRELLQLNDIIIKACEVEVEQRYQSAAELKADLRALQTRLAESK